MPRQSRILRIASGGLIAASILMRPEQLGTPGHRPRKRGAKAQPTNNSEGGMEYVAGQNIPLQGEDQLSPPILRDSRDARQAGDLALRGRGKAWHVGRFRR